MKLQDLLTTLYEVGQKTGAIVNISIYDELLQAYGLMALVKEGGAFKIYIQSKSDENELGEQSGTIDPAELIKEKTQDYLIGFTPELLKERKKDYPNIDGVCIEGLEPNRLKMFTINNFMGMRPMYEINDYLESN